MPDENKTNEGYEPEIFKKGYQPNEEESNTNPPKGGTGEVKQPDKDDETE